MPKSLLFLFLLVSKICFAQDTLVLITGKIIPVKSVDLRDYTITYRTLDGSKLKTIDPARIFSIKYASGAERIVFQTDSLDPIDFSENEMRRFIKGEQDARDFYRNHVVRYSSLVVGGVSSLGAIYGLPGPLLYATFVGGYSPNVQKKLSFEIGGNAAEKAGLKLGTVVNSSTGSVANPVFDQGSELKIGRKKYIFSQNINLDSAVALINSDFKKNKIHAINQDDKLRLFKSDNDANLNDEIYREGFEKRARDFKIRNALIGGLIGYVLGGITLSVILKN